MRKTAIPTWFGEISEEEIIAIRRETEKFEEQIARYQQRQMPSADETEE